MNPKNKVGTMSCTFKNPHNHAKGEVMMHHMKQVAPSAKRTVRPGNITHPSPHGSLLDSPSSELSNIALRTVIAAIDYVTTHQSTVIIPLEEHAKHAFSWRKPYWHSGMLLRTNDSWRKKTSGDLFSLSGTVSEVRARARPKTPHEILREEHLSTHRQFGNYRHKKLQSQIIYLFGTAIKASVQRQHFQTLPQTPLRESLIEGFEEAWEKELKFGHSVQPIFSHPGKSFFKLLSLYISFILNEKPKEAEPLGKTLELWFSGYECIGVTEQGHIVVYATH